MLVRVAALAAVDAPAISYLLNLGAAADIGIDGEQIRGVLTAIAPIVGTPRIASATGKIADALEVELEVAELAEEGERKPRRRAPPVLWRPTWPPQQRWRPSDQEIGRVVVALAPAVVVGVRIAIASQVRAYGAARQTGFVPTSAEPRAVRGHVDGWRAAKVHPAGMTHRGADARRLPFEFAVKRTRQAPREGADHDRRRRSRSHSGSDISSL